MIRVQKYRLYGKEMTVKELSPTHMAIILPVGGDPHTGSHSYWVSVEMVKITDDDSSKNIICELPENIYLDAQGIYWRKLGGG